MLERYNAGERNFATANFSGEDLCGATLSGVDLSHACLMGTRLVGADLSESDLSFADIKEANLQGINLSNAKLKGTDLRYTNLRGANLSGADLTEAVILEAQIDLPTYQLSNWRPADLVRAYEGGVEIVSLERFPEPAQQAVIARGSEMDDEYRERLRPQFEDRYRQLRPVYESLAKEVERTLERLLVSNGIPYLSVKGRAKSVESFIQKCDRKRYVDPFVQTTDFAGVRAILYIESDVAKVAGVVRREFVVHPNDSPDKLGELGTDRVGYRSQQFVCDLGAARCAPSENREYEGKRFEVQVRTPLQHAWAEIDHGRRYKFQGALPADLERRLNLIAGMLEVADREFADVARLIDEHAASVRGPSRT